jgi:PAS domain S-box-containing protein
LKESEEKYRNIVDLAPDGIITVDLRGVITCINATFTKLTGYSEKEVVGKHFTRIGALRTEDINGILNLFDSVANGQALPPTEFVYLRKDGTEGTAEAHISFLKSDGKTVGIQVVLMDISERKKAEKAIRDSQQKFQRLFVGIPEAAAYWDSNFRFLDINPRFTELFGYSLGEIKGKESTSLIVPENMVDESDLWGKNAKEGYIDHDTIRKRKDGSLVPVSMSVAPIIIQDQLIGYVGLYKDITERKKAKDRLEESEERYRLLFEQCPIGIGIATREGIVLDCNKTMEAVTGYSREELMKIDLTQTYENPEQRKALLETINKCGAALDFPVKLKRKDGISYDALLSVSLIRMGGKDFLQTICQDITKRKQIEEELRTSEEKYRNLFENARDVILTADMSGNITSINRAIEEYGWKAEEVVGKNMVELLPEESWPRLLRGIEEIARGESIDSEMEIVTPKGRRIAEYKSNPIIQDGKVVGSQLIGRDITERKRMEARLSALNYCGGKLNAVNSLEDVYELILDALEKTLGFECAEFNVNDNGVLQVACQRGFTGPVHDLPIDGSRGGLIVKAARSRKPLMVDDVTKEKEYVEGAPEIKSELAVPVVADDEVLGVLNVESKKTQAFNEKDVMLLEILASHAATAISNVRKRSQIETALERITESEEKYKGLFENARDVIVTVDCTGNVTSANNIVSEYGYKPNELVGKSLFSLFPEEYWKEFQSYFQKLTEGKPIEGEFRVKSKQMQGCRVIEYKSSPMIQNRKVIGAQVIARDVTERKEMEEELKKQKEEAEQYLDIVGNIIVALDANGKIILLNKKGYAVLGYNEGELFGKNWFETCLPEEVRNEVGTIFRGLMQGKLELYEYEENLVLTKAGEKRIVNWYNRLLKDNSGKVIGTLSSGEDITERKGMEQRLKQYSENLEELVQKRTHELLESEERYSILVEEAGDGVVIVQDEKIVFANRKAAEMLGYSENEIVGLDIEKVMEAKDYPIVKDRYEKRLRGEYAPPTYEIGAVDKAGQHLPFEISSARINHQGQPAVLAIFRDIRERKQIEEQRLRLERLAAIGELATMVAHDLRNPLTSVRNASFYIKNACPHASSRDCKTTIEMLDIIEQETLFAENVINDLLDFASVRPLEKEKKDIVEIIESSLARNIVPENVKIRKEFAETTLTIDGKQLERVFLNLVKNAVQAMPNGGELTIRINSTKEQVEIAFMDTGIGISEENMRKIFQPLFTTKAKGIGMGLPICRKIIEEHGGRIEVESKVDQGTTFRIKLPQEASD